MNKQTDFYEALRDWIRVEIELALAMSTGDFDGYMKNPKREADELFEKLKVEHWKDFIRKLAESVTDD